MNNGVYYEPIQARDKCSIEDDRTFEIESARAIFDHQLAFLIALTLTAGLDCYWISSIFDLCTVSKRYLSSSTHQKPKKKVTDGVEGVLLAYFHSSALCLCYRLEKSSISHGQPLRRQQQMLHTRLLCLHDRHNFGFLSSFFILHLLNFHTHSTVPIVRRSFSRAYVRLQ